MSVKYNDQDFDFQQIRDKYKVDSTLIPVQINSHLIPHSSVYLDLEITLFSWIRAL